tara:strand:+ start:283 stop:399 length:117 start_codon:yes stop_codon:yes gene_type:complete
MTLKPLPLFDQSLGVKLYPQQAFFVDKFKALCYEICQI